MWWKKKKVIETKTTIAKKLETVRKDFYDLECDIFLKIAQIHTKHGLPDGTYTLRITREIDFDKINESLKSKPIY